MMTTPKKSLLTVSEVVEKTGKARSTVYNWIAGGDIKTRKIGKTIYITVESLRKFLGEHAKEIGIDI